MISFARALTQTAVTWTQIGPPHLVEALALETTPREKFFALSFSCSQPVVQYVASAAIFQSGVQERGDLLWWRLVWRCLRPKRLNA